MTQTTNSPVDWACKIVDALGSDPSKEPKRFVAIVDIVRDIQFHAKEEVINA